MNSYASWSITGQKVQSGNSVCSQLELATQSSREAKSPASSVLKNLTLSIPFSLQYKYPLYPRNVESFQREYWERNPREKQDWLIHNLHIETLQIPLLSSSPLSNSSTLILSITKTFSHHIHSYERAVWCFGKQLGRNQFHIGWCYGQVAESGKLEKK